MFTAEDFNNTYNKVFDANGNVVACGRNMCSKLINIAKCIGDKNVNYGNVDTGYMNIASIKELHTRLNT